MPNVTTVHPEESSRALFQSQKNTESKTRRPPSPMTPAFCLLHQRRYGNETAKILSREPSSATTALATTLRSRSEARANIDQRSDSSAFASDSAVPKLPQWSEISQLHSTMIPALAHNPAEVSSPIPAPKQARAMSSMPRPSQVGTHRLRQHFLIFYSCQYDSPPP
jgi:hypothetical protein